MRFIVTGAAGFIGSHLARRLQKDGHEVIGVDCFTDYYEPELKRRNAAGIEVTHADLAADPLDELFSRADGIFHLAARPGARSFGAGFPLYVRENILASERVFATAAKTGRRVVFASSSSIYGEAEHYPTGEDATPKPISPYGITKLACEHLARVYAHDVVTLRYFTVYGPRQRPDMAFAKMVDALVGEREFELYGDSQSRSFTYVDDVVAATMLAMERASAGAVYNVGGREESIGRAIVILEELAGRRLLVTARPRGAGDMPRTAADTSRIRSELEWSPQVSLEEGLRAQWECARTDTLARF